MESIELSMSIGPNKIGDITNSQFFYWEENVINVNLNDSNGFDSSNDEFSLDNKQKETSIINSTKGNSNRRYQKSQDKAWKSREESDLSKSKRNELGNIKSPPEKYWDSQRKQTPKYMKTKNKIQETYENSDKFEQKHDEESEYLENDDTVFFKMNSYDHDEVEHFQNILKQTQTDVWNNNDHKIIKQKSGISKESSSKKKNQTCEIEVENKSATKNVWLMDDEELDFELDFDADDNHSNSSYVDVSIEREDESNRSKSTLKKHYSKTFANHIHQETYEKVFVKENVKPCIKNPNKKKQTRFGSPRINLQKLNDSNRSSESSKNYKGEKLRKHRRRSGKVKISNKQECSSEDETEVLKQEYLKLKKQLLELQKTKSKQK